MDLSDCVDHIFGRHALEHIAASPRFKSTPNLHVSFKGCQHDDAGFGKLHADSDHGVDTTHVGKAEVHERHVRSELGKLLNGLLSVGRLTYHKHIRLIINDGTDTLAQ